MSDKELKQKKSLQTESVYSQIWLRLSYFAN